ncbi:MAG TPA: dienelactone hydrolase family protein [Dactylosporangium sp.]|nr:dienelactone hydrolase family protein [Dactylosporangium sp.]
MLNLAGMTAYVARPGGPGPHPGVVVGHLIFGVDESTRRCADRLAAAGFLAIVPDLYHRTAPGADLPRDDEGRRRGLELMRTLTRDGVVEDVGRCVEWLLGPGGAGPRVGMLGVSLGGHVAFVAAARLDLAATAALFPGWLTGTEIPLSTPDPTVALAPGIRGRVLFLVGDRDHVVPAADVARVGEALSVAGVAHEVVVYPGAEHGFFPDGPGPAAEDAWRRVTDLFATAL